MGSTAPLHVFSVVVLLLLHAIFLASSSAAAFQIEVNVWPKPTSVSWPGAAPVAIPLSSSFRVLNPYPDNPYLSAAAARYTRLLLFERYRPLRPSPLNLSSSAQPLHSLALSVADASTPLRHGVDESYTLSISANDSSSVAELVASTPWGAIRGLETISQLAWGDPPFVPAGIRIEDRPLFPHRGLLLDTSRNYYPVRDILRTIRAMSHNKLNVFHWHITDSQSFPILLPSVPDLALRGSYGPSMRYSPADVRRIVRYAMRRGIRVVPEIDAPGHTGSWAEAYPEIVTCANRFWAPSGGPALAAEPGTGQLNPLLPKTYEVVRNVLRDVASLFPDSFLHVGADEVNPACWEQDPAIKQFLDSGATHDQLLELFVNATHPFIVSALNRTAVYWEDVILGPTVKLGSPGMLPPETTVLQTWNNGPNNTKLLTSAGYRVIVSSSDFYYLDCGFGGWVGNDSRYDRQTGDEPGKPFNYAGGNGGSWCAPFKSWQRVYDYDITYGLSAEEVERVLGSEVALWSEQADGSVVDGRLWPRAAAMAEALWSGNRDGEGKKRYAEATDRLVEWRQRMVQRGIAAEPIQPLWCIMNPGMCNIVNPDGPS
ncbi:beta-hexosaminidase 2 [Canna indica]|uniref:Beta-hexosaminidase n=1 Tax=Canna indica TaxID=4628 RepID=A0AAQ3K8B8_9LILI|nr:beta-hexosaminidase 2 [Canna indica]